jgi:hypothetical protein
VESREQECGSGPEAAAVHPQEAGDGAENPEPTCCGACRSSLARIAAAIRGESDRARLYYNLTTDNTDSLVLRAQIEVYDNIARSIEEAL